MTQLCNIQYKTKRAFASAFSQLNSLIRIRPYQTQQIAWLSAATSISTPASLTWLIFMTHSLFIETTTYS